MLAVLAACFPPRPPPAPPRSSPLGLTIEHATLDNGLRVITVLDPNATEAQVTMRYRVGAIDDAATPGVAHFVEHLMFQQMLDGESLYSHLEDDATYFNATTTYDATTFVSRAPRTKLDKLLAVEIARMELRCQTISDAAFAREREVVANELRQRDQVTEIFGAIHRALYPAGHPYRANVGGTVDSVGAITRDTACRLADLFYTPDNAVLVISGSFTRPDLETSLAVLNASISKRAPVAPSVVPQVTPQPHYVEVPAPIDDDVFVLAWPLPSDPVMQTKVRAIARALPLLVDSQIKGQVVSIELGDRSAPLIGIAVVPGDGETYAEAAHGARRGIDNLANVFAEADPRSVDAVVFDKLKQGAMYSLYTALDDGGDRDDRLATALMAGRDPAAAVAADLRALQDLTRSEGAWIASQYLSSYTPTGVTLRASKTERRGEKVSLAAKIHDLGQRRSAPDPALARVPAEPIEGRQLAVATRVLPNGLKVVLVPATTAPTFDARLVFSSGTGDERPAERGVALLAAHTLTWDLHYANDLFPFARAGALHTTDVTTDRTTFSVQGLDENLHVVLAALRRWVREGTYDESAASYAEGMRRASKRVDDQGLLTDAWRAALFGKDHPYAAAGIARLANPALTLGDASRFRSTHYTPDNATLVIAGRFDPALANRWIDYLFADWQGHAAQRGSPASTSQPLAIAKLDDAVLSQLRIAMPAGKTGRAQELVAAAMLDDVVHDVRHRLGASYTIDAQLAETRLGSFFSIGGWVDGRRAAAALQLIRDRIAQLRTDPTAAARAFVIARRHVLTQLRSQVGSASAIATRIEQDVAMAREPLSDVRTAAMVQQLTLDDMTATLATLDIARATLLMTGSAAEIREAFDVLDRKPLFIEGPGPTDDTASPANTLPAFVTQEQHVRLADLEPAITEQQPAPLALLVAPSVMLATTTAGTTSTWRGFSAAVGAGYRSRRFVLGGLATFGRLSSSSTSNAPSLVPLSLYFSVRLSGGTGYWVDGLFGVHAEHALSWTTDGAYGLQAGFDFSQTGVHRLGAFARYESSLSADAGFSALSFGLVYQQ